MALVRFLVRGLYPGIRSLPISMKICRTLSVTGTPGSLQGMLDDIRGRRPRGWRFDTPLSPGLFTFVRTPGDKPGDLMVFFGYFDVNKLIVANAHATPDWPGDFTMDDFNDTVVHFAEAIRPFVEKWGLTLTLGSSEGELRDQMSPTTFRALQDFVEVNGHSDALADAYWARFLNYLHIEQSLVRPPVLAEWLRLQGWADDEAGQWARHFTRGLTTLDMQAALVGNVKVVRLADLPAASAHVQ